MTEKIKNGLFWFKHDLRLIDNAPLYDFCRKVEEASFVYVVDPRWFKPGHYQSAHMGKHRWRFLKESLSELQNELKNLGHTLQIYRGMPVEVISELCSQLHIGMISTGEHPGVYENQQWLRLQERFSDVRFESGVNYTLFNAEDLPFPIKDLPKNFTPFRKKVEELEITSVLKVPHLPKSLDVSKVSGLTKESLDNNEFEDSSFLFKGGAESGLARLDYYLFKSQKVLRYKETRNGLDEFDDSTKFSPWVANGSVSPRQIYHKVKQFEQEVEANDSTYWVYFELLWREFFQWHLRQHQSALFARDGVRNKKPLTSFWPERFAKWCQGETPYPIVNACMRQLNETGYMSNRGRQLVASCLVHELNLDWRYGAAYFEQQLIDFDVASNWGNWQYLAGVGADPRGHRQFDLDKQTRTYDPNGEFIKKWCGDQPVQPLDSTDMTDWPIQWH